MRPSSASSASSAELAAREQSTPWSVGWLRLGRVATVVALVLCLALQQINHDFFPPEISISQYGIGPRGWVFTAWAAVVALAALSIFIANPVRRRSAGYLLVAGSIGLVVMGIVRTDADGLQHSWHAKVHMVSSILALVAFPIGMALGLHWAQLWWRRTGWSLLVVGDAALIMVGVSATGVATPGWDAQQSWALWQAVAVSFDMVLLGVFACATFLAGQD